jgi:RimJ/RimL family protein N-acetyltransferase
VDGGSNRMTRIHGPRLDLILLSPGMMRSLLAADWAAVEPLLGARVPDDWRSADWRWLRDRPSQSEADPAMIPWFPRAMLLREGAERPETIVVGHAGFHGPPDEEGRVEMGYTVIAEHRRRGYAEEAIRALMGWALSEQGVTRFRASVGPWNAPSLNLVRKLGFVRVGVQWDEEDGEELVFHRDGLPA